MDRLDHEDVRLLRLEGHVGKVLNILEGLAWAEGVMCPSAIEACTVTLREKVRVVLEMSDMLPTDHRSREIHRIVGAYLAGDQEEEARRRLHADLQIALL